MAEQDGNVQAVVTETPAPAVEATVDPIEAKIQAAVNEALKAKDQEIARKIQSEADKRVAPIQRRLSEAERRNQVLEATISNLPHSLGEVDPEVKARVQMAGLQGKVNIYEQERQANMAAQREQEAKETVLQKTREEVAELGLDPDDPRITYDLNQPDPDSFRRKVLASVRTAQREDSKKELESYSQKITADVEAKLRKATGVDQHDSGTGTTLPTFTRAQIRDRKFYVANREAIEKAVKEGRLKE
jgi:hypothetical protein